MRKNYLGIFYGSESGLIRVARLSVCIVENSIERGAKKLHWALSRVQNKVQIAMKKAILGVKRRDIAKVHFVEYPPLKVKKANSLYVIREK